MWCLMLPAYITHINIQGLQQMLLQVCLYLRSATFSQQQTVLGRHDEKYTSGIKACEQYHRQHVRNTAHLRSRDIRVDLVDHYVGSLHVLGCLLPLLDQHKLGR